MPTALDVIDTAVKVGLGAAITAISTVVAIYVNRRQDRRVEASERTRNLVEKVVIAASES
jgi:hypothetical protein